MLKLLTPHTIILKYLLNFVISRPLSTKVRGMVQILRNEATNSETLQTTHLLLSIAINRCNLWALTNNVRLVPWKTESVCTETTEFNTVVGEAFVYDGLWTLGRFDIIFDVLRQGFPPCCCCCQAE